MKAKTIFISSISLLFIATTAITIVILVTRKNDIANSSSVSEPPAPSIPPAPTLVSANSRWLFSGNVYWGRYINDWSMASDLQFAYPFSRLSEFHPENYNAWIAGLECPLKSGLLLTSAQEEGTLSFNCRPEYLPEAAKYFTAFTLANNHTDNQGAEAFTETQTNLAEAGIQYFGHYDPNNLDQICNVVTLPVNLHYDSNTTKTAALPIVFCGYHGVFQVIPDPSLQIIQNYAEHLPVISMPHTGAEYLAEPDSIKTNTYRKMIDYGADMVIGDHPHWIQTTEVYNGKLIAYSLGNFMFDQQYNTEVTRSALIDVTATTHPDLTPEIIEKYTSIADDCQNNLTGCIELIKANNLPRLTLNYTFDALGSDDSGKITKPATPDQLESIKQRLLWNSTSAGLTSSKQ